MSTTRRCRAFRAGGPCLLFLLLAAPAPAQEPPFRPGDVVEYKVLATFPPQWEKGTVLRILPGGKQVLVRLKPDQFNPQGAERAYTPAELRRPGKTVAKNTEPRKPLAPLGTGKTAPLGKGLLSEADVLAYARREMGDRPFTHPERDAILDRIRDHIKTRGTSFRYDAATGAFRNKMDKQRTMSVHIGYAVNANYGPHPRLQDYFGTFHLRTANRGSRSLTPGGKYVIRTDAQHESGRLTISPKGTWEWELLRGDPPAKWLRGKWRPVRPDEMHLWEGGPALWLLEAKQGSDYMVRMSREPGWQDWIDVGAGKGRTPVEFGRRP